MRHSIDMIDLCRYLQLDIQVVLREPEPFHIVLSSSLAVTFMGNSSAISKSLTALLSICVGGRGASDGEGSDERRNYIDQYTDQDPTEMAALVSECKKYCRLLLINELCK